MNESSDANISRTEGMSHDEDENRPAITGASALVGGLAGGVVGAAAAGAAVGGLTGPVGAGIGAVVGIVAGAMSGRSIGNSIDPAAENDYWSENYSTLPYANG